MKKKLTPIPPKDKKPISICSFKFLSKIKSGVLLIQPPSTKKYRHDNNEWDINTKIAEIPRKPSIEVYLLSSVLKLSFMLLGNNNLSKAINKNGLKIFH
ncbi:hypothetical protein GA0061080_102916 [Gilliamella intestini]|uniref:Uncharacterized protein n=1 Tax=Gilliamella intestini TaxID=1798183 RepID=A0A1C4C3S3_9GAMM|nr:hypothetical protein [Gilliamella intestini]SCC13730.1 hypothetical protein GA0061080_102916 [Gilliamella intestini]